MKRVVCFGEIMLRLNPPGYGRFVQAESFAASFAGAESNVAVSLSNYGVDAAFVSKIPAHEIGQMAVNALRRYGVDTSLILRGGSRLGVLYLEKGAGQRASKVIYDRSDSAFALAERGEFDWDRIFSNADWFHFTGITPALGENGAALCREAVQAAKKLGVKVSCDLNYRKKLWSIEEAGRVMGGLMPYVDVCVAGWETAAALFGIAAEGSDAVINVPSKDNCVSIAKKLTERFGFESMAVTMRGNISAVENTWSGMLYTGGAAYFGPEYKIQIVDRIGGGDSFSGGLIYALLENYNPRRAIDFAVAASCLKHSIENDFNLVGLEEVESLLAGDASGKVQR